MNEKRKKKLCKYRFGNSIETLSKFDNTQKLVSENKGLESFNVNIKREKALVM